jgi:TolB-like protein/Tfp pilus assembly protein PilF
VTEPSHAVFLSYASQDAEAAAKICDALRAAGIEVWFDKSELRGGDAWDQSIRRQIKSCALFIPIISRNTDARPEGYFRLEWKLAVDRSHLFTATKAFLVPVAIDDTPGDDEQVPDRFWELQWTRLPAGETSAAFVERVQHLLSGEGSTTIRALSPVKENASRSRRVLPLALAVVIAAALLLAFGISGREGLFGSKSSAPGAASIAVLPLANESGEASEQYFSDGISEDLITALSQFQGLKVIGRSSAFKFRDSKDDSRSIGSKLGVAHLLEGSVRKSGNMIRVNAELINVADGSTQWSQRYDRPYKDLFALQDDITHAVARALKTKLLPGEHAAQQSERPPGGSLDAYDAMLQARFYALRGSEADVRKAIEYKTKAIALDPNYALAWSNLSIDWTGLGQSFVGGTPGDEARAKARAAADRALALAPELAQAHLARADVLLWTDFNWAAAGAEFQRALELAPDEGRTKASFAVSLATLGNVQRAIELTRDALATDPLRAFWYNQLARYSTALNRLDEADQAIHRAMELQPTVTSHYEVLTIIEIQRRNAQAALAAAQQVAPGPRQDVALASARQIGHDRAAADVALKALIQKYAGDAAVQIADVYALRNDAKATFDWLDRAWSNRDPGVSEIYFDPFILRYKDDARFVAFCRKIGLPVPGKASAGTTI